MHFTRRFFVKLAALGWWSRPVPSSVLGAEAAASSPPSRFPFGEQHRNLDSLTTGAWWTQTPPQGAAPPPPMDVPRNETVAFALYTHDAGVLKMTAQLYPLKPEEATVARLEIEEGGGWREIAVAEVHYPGWSAHFRVAPWDGSRDVNYRVRHGEEALFAGRIRRDPIDKPTIVVAAMSCNSSRTGGLRHEIVDNLLQQDPDLLFFAGDQTYRETQHTAGWIEFGLQFRDVIRDRPTVTIPDDHDVGQPNLWGENGKLSTLPGNADGGYKYPAEYVNMVQRQQTWHLPDPDDARPIERGITVYFTRLRVGGVDFAILEDRKFKSGPAGKIPQQGPRPDHVNDPSYDPASIDLPDLALLGERQMRFLRGWGADWSGAVMKVVLSQTAFCGAVHMHGGPTNRLLADLDCNGWPQSQRNDALREIRRAHAFHLCGDQHLAVVVKHGIDAWGDGPYGFTSPALVNTIYGRWWHPPDEQPGPHPRADCPLPWTGDYADGLGNKISMLAYANPPDITNERSRGDGYALVRFDKAARTARFECWPRFADARAGDSAQYPGWPITVAARDNDGRQPTAWLPPLNFADLEDAVVQVIDVASGEPVYAIRTQGRSFQPWTYGLGAYRIRFGPHSPDRTCASTFMAGSPDQPAVTLQYDRP